MTEELLPLDVDLTLLRSRFLPERRQLRRYRCNLASIIKFELANSTDTQITWAYNLSQEGVGLNAPHALEVGQEIIINVRVHEKEVDTIPAQVVFCRLHDDQSWRIGCAFLKPLSQDTLNSLLK